MNVFRSKKMVIVCRTQQLLKCSKTLLPYYYHRESSTLPNTVIHDQSISNLHTSREPRSTLAKLTPQEVIAKINVLFMFVNLCFQVDNTLRANEYTHEFSEGSVKSYDSNQLASNNPVEDTRSEASCLLTTGML